MALTDKLVAIGDAIREKKGTSDLIPLADMPQAIRDIVSGGTIEPVLLTSTMTSNATPSGVCFANSVGYSRDPYLAFGNQSLDVLVGTQISDVGHHWAQNTTIEDAYIGYDFGEGVSYYIDNVIYYPCFYMVNAGAGATVKVQGSNDYAEWEDISEPIFVGSMGYVTSGAVLSKVQIACESSKAYRYVRIKPVEFLAGDGYVTRNGKPAMHNRQIEIYGATEISMTEIDAIETLIDESGVLDSTEGTATEKVVELIDKAQSGGSASIDENGVVTFGKNTSVDENGIVTL